MKIMKQTLLCSLLMVSFINAADRLTKIISPPDMLWLVCDTTRTHDEKYKETRKTIQILKKLLLKKVKDMKITPDNPKCDQIIRISYKLLQIFSNGIPMTYELMPKLQGSELSVIPYWWHNKNCLTQEDIYTYNRQARLINKYRCQIINRWRVSETFDEFKKELKPFHNPVKALTIWSHSTQFIYLTNLIDYQLMQTAK